MMTIVGAGLVGSLWGLLLQKKGYKVSIYEKRSDPRLQKMGAGRSINLVVTSRGLKGLHEAGLGARIHELAVPVYGRMIHAKNGTLTYQAYGQDKECNYSVSRGELNNFLISEAEKAGVKFHFEHEVQELSIENKQVHFKKPLAGTVSISYDILFGADGAGSRLRNQLAKLFPDQFTETTDWLEADYKELTLPKTNTGLPALKTDALHIWPRGAHMMMALANRDGSFTVTSYLPKENSTWSFEKLKKDSDIVDLFESEFADAIPLMPEYLQEFNENPQGHLGTVRCTKWVFKDCIALMGDAAHAIVPFFGQGMNSGFEDCTTLFSLIEKHAGAWPLILKEFEDLQKPSAKAIADMALENWTEMRDKVGDQKFLLRKKLEAAIEEKYPGLYKSRYGLITYTLVPYPLAQKAGLKQDELMEKILKGVSAFEQISWPLVDELVKTMWLPFVKENHLDIKNFPQKTSMIPITKTSQPKTKPDVSKLGFGKYFSDHMFVSKYSTAKGWHNSEIIPYQSLQIDPGASVLHYGQALFEGMKAFRQKNNQCILFRPDFNWDRLKMGADRLCMEVPSKELFLEGIHQLVKVDQDWIPSEQGSSLYIRPTLIGTESFLGVRPAEELLFFVILSPVGSYYSGGITPVKIWIEEEYIRAAPGGLGATKAAANYAGSLKAAFQARKKGYSQVLWLDVSRKYVEEVGTMNVFFIFDHEIITPALDGTILGGGVRDCLMTLLKSYDRPLIERKISVQEITDGIKSGRLQEAFGTGTAAVITPIGELASSQFNGVINNNKIGPITQKLYDALVGIQYGTRPDPYNWVWPL